jgi:hypothetical protein
MKTIRSTTRRDQCWYVSRRAELLTPNESCRAWKALAETLADMGDDTPIPKFKALLRAIRTATIAGKKKTTTATDTP